MATTKYVIGSQSNLLTTELNTLTNNSLAIGSAFNNTVGQTGDGYILCDLELVCTYGTNPTANTACLFWFIGSQDGTNYEDGDASTTPTRMPDAIFPLRVTTSGQRIIRRVPMPAGLFKPLLKNDGTGQSMAGSGNTLKIRPISHQSA